MPSLQDFSDDLLLSILSYIAVLPYEASTLAKQSNLTDVLPLVNKRFYSLCSKSDYLWKVGVERLIRIEPVIWGEPLLRRLLLQKTAHESCPALVQQQAPTPSKNDDASKKVINYRQTFKETLKNDVLITMPLFYDNTDQDLPNSGMEIGEEFDIYVHQAQHQALISKLMKEFASSNPSYRNGDEITPEDHDALVSGLGHRNRSVDRNNIRRFPTCPTFVYFSKPVEQPLQRNSSNEEFQDNADSETSPLPAINQIAVSVQVRECLIYPDNSAHLSLMPTSYVRVENIYERPTTAHGSTFYDARVSFSNKHETAEWVVKQKECALQKRRKGLLSTLESLSWSFVRSVPYVMKDIIWNIFCFSIIFIQLAFCGIFKMKSIAWRKIRTGLQITAELK